MKYSEIDFETITRLNRDLEKMKMLFNEDYHTLQEFYLRIDLRLMRCLTEHRTLDSELRRLDFARLSEICFSDRRYIFNRIKKMDKGFKCLLNMKRV